MRLDETVAPAKHTLLACSNPELKKSLDQVKERYVSLMC